MHEPHTMTDHPNREEILQTLHGMISERLFGGGRWSASLAECVVLREKLTLLWVAGTCSR